MKKKGTFRGEKGTWQGLWVHEGKSRLTSREEAQKIVAGIENRQGVVTSSKKTKKSQPPPLLYSLTDLQQDANIRTLTGGKTTRKYVFKTQTDGKFRAKLKLEQNQSGRWETVMLERKNY